MTLWKIAVHLEGDTRKEFIVISDNAIAACSKTLREFVCPEASELVAGCIEFERATEGLLQTAPTP